MNGFPFAEIKEINMKKQAKTMMMKIAALDRIKLSRPIAVLEDDKPESEPEGEVSESEEESEVCWTLPRPRSLDASSPPTYFSFDFK